MGTLIFVGIMFTAVIPMFLVMRQADTLHEIRKHEQEILDQEKMNEAVYIYVFPATDPTTGNPILTLKAVNRGDFVVKIVKIWINDNSNSEENFIVNPMGMYEIILDDGYFIPEDGKYYFIKVTTDRGNIFSSESGSLHYSSEGTWEEGMFAINVLISHPEPGWYQVDINHSNGEALNGSPFPIRKDASGPAFGFFNIIIKDTYYVKITKNSALIKDEYVTIDWPEYPPVVWVFA